MVGWFLGCVQIAKQRWQAELHQNEGHSVSQAALRHLRERKTSANCLSGKGLISNIGKERLSSQSKTNNTDLSKPRQAENVQNLNWHLFKDVVQICSYQPMLIHQQIQQKRCLASVNCQSKPRCSSRHAC